MLESKPIIILRHMQSGKQYRVYSGPYVSPGFGRIAAGTIMLEAIAQKNGKDFGPVRCMRLDSFVPADVSAWGLNNPPQV